MRTLIFSFPKSMGESQCSEMQVAAEIEQRWVEYLLWRRVWNSFYLFPPGQQTSLTL